jgi:hypothetical protein
MASIIAPLFRASGLLSQGAALFKGTAKNKIGDLVIDVCTKENIKFSSTITEHPLETKESVNDHIFKDSRKIRIEGFITDTPMRLFGILETPLQNNSVSSLISNIKALSPFNQNAKPSTLAFQLLRKLWEDRALITVVTSLESFSNMAITNLDSNKDSDTGGRFEFVIELMQLKFANVKTTLNANFKSKLTQSVGSALVNTGIVEKDSSNVTTNKSIAAMIFDAIKGAPARLTEKIERSERASKVSSFY